jgi:hypothetical protein
MYTLQKFAESKWSLVVYQQCNAIFRSQASGIRPLITYINRYGTKKSGLVIFDKNVGRAAALLMILIKPKKIYTSVISKKGLKALNESKIDYFANKRVKYLKGIASDDICKWEKLATGKKPLTFWRIVRNI